MRDKRFPKGYNAADMVYPPFVERVWVRCRAYPEDHLPIAEEDQEDPPISWCGRTLYDSSHDEWWTVKSKRSSAKCGPCNTAQKEHDAMLRFRMQMRKRSGDLNPLYDFQLTDWDFLPALARRFVNEVEGLE